MRRLKSRDVFLIVLVGVLAISGLWYTLLYQPLQQAIATRTADRDAINQKVMQVRVAANSLPQLKAQLEELKKTRDGLADSLPPAPELGDFLDDLRGLYTRAGVKINNVSVGTPSSNNLPQGVKSMALTLSVEGTFAGLYRLLKGFEDLKRFTTIESLNMSLGGMATDSNPKLTAQLGVTIYIFDTGNNTAISSPATQGGVQ